MQDFYHKYKHQNFEILSVSVDIQGADVVKPYVADKAFTSVIDTDNSLANYFEFKIGPNGIIVDKNSTIRLIKQGFHVSNPTHLDAIEKLIHGTVEKLF